MKSIIVVLFTSLLLVSCGSDAPVEIEELKLVIPEDGFDIIKKKRSEALAIKLLVANKADYVPCHLIYNGDTIKSKARLKGDHMDHLAKDRWSFRIKTKSPVFGNKKFSIHNVAARRYQLEWAFHLLLKEVGVIGLDYHFVKFSVNDSLKGVYAFESHFKKELLAKNGREEGLIFGFDESTFWSGGRFHHLKGKERDDSLMLNAPFKIYNKSWANNNKEKTEKALNKLRFYLMNVNPPQLSFDLNLWAKYIAVSELMGYNHNLRWHNLKFYYNPKTDLIEPIGFDASANFDNSFIWISSKKRELFYDPMYESLKPYLFSSFKQVGDEGFLDNFFDKYEEETELCEKQVQLEYPEYEFQKDAFYYSAKKLQGGIEDFKNNGCR